ncbi:hypothetical protein ACOMHN_053552 [Nucella lapillus]
MTFSLLAVGSWGSPMVATKYGKIQGVYVESAAVFYGMPFASPPIGTMRWKQPLEPRGWGSAVYKATSVKPACPQYDCQRLTPPLVCPTQTSEDCLYLDIFTPKSPPLPANSTAGYPVMVFLHGGNFDLMSGFSPLFDGRRLAGTRRPCCQRQLPIR